MIPLTINRGESDDHGQIYNAIISGKDLYGDFEPDGAQPFLPELSKESFGSAVKDLFAALRNEGHWDYVLVDTRGGFGFTTTDVCGLADSFILVTEPDFTSFYQIRNLLRRISASAEEQKTKSILRGVIINKATEGVDPTSAPGEAVRRLDMSKIEVEFRSLLADEFLIKYQDTHPVPLDIVAVKAYKAQRLPYLLAPDSIYSFSTLKAFSGMLTSVTQPWAEDRYVRWNHFIDEISRAINATNEARIRAASVLEEKENKLVQLNSDVERLQKTLESAKEEREDLKRRHQIELERLEFVYRNEFIKRVSGELSEKSEWGEGPIWLRWIWSKRTWRIMVPTSIFLVLAILSFPEVRSFVSDLGLSPEKRIYRDLMETGISRAQRSEAVIAAVRQRLELSRIDLSLIDLTDADVSGGDFSGANLRQAVLRRTNLSRSMLRGALLAQSNMEGANLSGSDLSFADLEEADLRGANLLDTNLKNTNLRGANLFGAIMNPADLHSAILDQRTKLDQRTIIELGLGKTQAGEEPGSSSTEQPTGAQQRSRAGQDTERAPLSPNP